MPSEETKQLTGRKLIDAPLANLSGPDAAVAEKLRELIANRGDRFFARKEERDAVEAFYRDRGFRPLWLENGKINARTNAAIAFLKKVDEDARARPTMPRPISMSPTPTSSPMPNSPTQARCSTSRAMLHPAGASLAHFPRHRIQT